ncbi:MAG TPA: hypothetical protein VKC60_05940 [Opitutaceae bacterium]|nr:hypothetical protein [Opitutaceae bacterium]
MPKNFLSVSAAFIALMFSGCSRGPDLPPARTKPNNLVTLKDVQRVFDQRCIACHAPGAYEDGSAMGGLVLSSGKAARNLISAKSLESTLNRVTPGDLSKSYLYHKLRGSFAQVGGTGVKMPLSGSIPEEEILLIEDWILSGAPTNE